MPEASRTSPVSFRDQDVERRLLERASDGVTRGTIAARDLDRYYRLLEADLPDLTPGEWNLLRDALNGTLMEPSMMRLLYMEVSDGLSDGLAEKWHVDGPGLVAKLQALSPAGCYAVADAVERWWARQA